MLIAETSSQQIGIATGRMALKITVIAARLRAARRPVRRPDGQNGPSDKLITGLSKRYDRLLQNIQFLLLLGKSASWYTLGGKSVNECA